MSASSWRCILAYSRWHFPARVILGKADRPGGATPASARSRSNAWSGVGLASIRVGGSGDDAQRCTGCQQAAGPQLLTACVSPKSRRPRREAAAVVQRFPGRAARSDGSFAGAASLRPARSTAPAHGGQPVIAGNEMFLKREPPGRADRAAGFCCAAARRQWQAGAQPWHQTSD